jgi:hypothetical protein
MNAALLAIRAIAAASLVAGMATLIDDDRGTPMPVRSYEETTTISDRVGEGWPGSHRRDEIVDRYGNRIEEAVGDYRVDPRGDIFERHSPATEIPRLAEPST